jgi:nicotinamidase-related amidase
MLSSENAVLLVVDVQGKLAHMMHEKEFFFENVRKMIQGAKILDIPIVWLEQYPKGLGVTIPEVSELLTNLKPIEKITFNCCLNQDFQQAVSAINRKQVMIVGMETHICVYQSTIGLLNLGYAVYIVSDAVSSRTAENKKIGLELAKSAGAQITGTETVLFELLQVAEGDRFKKVLQLVK